MFDQASFTSHSGLQLDWKINCDDLTDKDIDCLAYVVQRNLSFGEVVGIPTGGNRFARALEKYAVKDVPVVLIVDDVLTTGSSMEEMRELLKPSTSKAVIGVVIFARKKPADWIIPIFELGLCG